MQKQFLYANLTTCIKSDLSWNHLHSESLVFKLSKVMMKLKLILKDYFQCNWCSISFASSHLNL